MPSTRCPVAPGLLSLPDPLRDADFLRQMEHLLPWQTMVDAAGQSLAQAAARPQTGVQHAAAALLRIHFVQSWFGLSDQAMADMLLCVPLYRRFAQLEGVLRPLPDVADIRRFRYRATRTALGMVLLRQMQRLAPRHPQLAGVQTAPDAALIAWAASQEAGSPITSRT